MTSAVTAELFTLTANTRKAETLEVSVKRWRRVLRVQQDLDHQGTEASAPTGLLGMKCNVFAVICCSYNSSAWWIKGDLTPVNAG